MFSRYTWGDFFLVGVSLTALYYAYVALVYYREDIREWISNRGSKSVDSAATAEEAPDAAEEDESDLYSVHSYGFSSPSDNQPPASPTPVASRPVPQPASEDLNLDGAVVTEQDQNGFNLPVNGTVHRQAEERLDDVLEVANRVSKDENGLVKPKDEQDQQAARIASMINYQAGQAAFADISFNR